MRPLVRFHDQARSDTSLAAVASGHALDVEGLGALLSVDAPSPLSRTIYDGVRLEILPDAWRADPNTPITKLPPAQTVGEARKRVRDVVERAVEGTIGNATCVAVLASGGIDSSTILALAHRILARRGGSAFAVAIDFGGPGDDRPYLEALAKHLGCKVVRVSPKDGARFLDAVRTGVDASPLFWPFTPVQLAVYEAARNEGAEVALTGVGGDDFFDGDPRALAALAKRHPIDAVKRARALHDFWQPEHPVFEHIVRGLLAEIVPRSLRRAAAVRRREPPTHSPWASPLLLAITDRLTDRALELTLYGDNRPTTYFERSARYHFAFLHQQEQHGSGLTRRDPLLTEEVASMIESIPPPMLFATGRRRELLRDAMRGTVPDMILDRPDKALFAPAWATFVDAIGGLRAFDEELEGKNLGRLGLVDASVFRREIVRALEAEVDDGQYAVAWAALATESFLLRHPGLA